MFPAAQRIPLLIPIFCIWLGECQYAALCRLRTVPRATMPILAPPLQPSAVPLPPGDRGCSSAPMQRRGEHGAFAYDPLCRLGRDLGVTWQLSWRRRRAGDDRLGGEGKRAARLSWAGPDCPYDESDRGRVSQNSRSLRHTAIRCLELSGRKPDRHFPVRMAPSPELPHRMPQGSARSLHPKRLRAAGSPPPRPARARAGFCPGPWAAVDAWEANPWPLAVCQ